MKILEEQKEGTFLKLKSSFKEIFGKPESQTDKQANTKQTTNKTKGESP